MHKSHSCDLKVISVIIKQKVADHYFVTKTVLGEEPVAGNILSTRSILISNNKVDKLMHDFDWTVLLSLYHMSLYDRLIDILRDIYMRASRVVKLKQRKAGNVWISKEILEICHQKDKLWSRLNKIPAMLHLKTSLK